MISTLSFLCSQYRGLLRLVLQIGIAIAIGQWIDCQSRAAEPPADCAAKASTYSVFWECYLAETTTRHGWHYTLEQFDDPAERGRHELIENTEVETAEQLIEKLNANVKGYHFVKSPSSSTTIHAIQNGLERDVDYALDKTVTLTYQGPLGGLLETIETRLMNIGPPRNAGSEYPGDSRSTKVALNVDGLSIRQVLTDAIPREGYATELWQAVTLRGEDGQRTVIRFGGQVAKVIRELDESRRRLLSGEMEKTDVWEFYFWEMCRRNGWHCTVEVIRGSKADRPQYVEVDYSISTMDKLIAKLEREVRGFRFVRSERHDSIVHAIQRDLETHDAYPLDAVIDLVYSGSIEELARAVQTKVPNIGSRWDEPVMGTGDLFGDPNTKVRVDVKAAIIRDILTDAVPLDGYFPELWRATTERIDGKWKTLVQYRGRDRFPRRDKQ